MTPDELTAIEARHIPRSTSNRDAVIVCHRDSRPWPCDTHEVLAALRTEQEARARVEPPTEAWTGAVGAMENMLDFIRNGKASLSDEDVANLKTLLELDLSLIGKAFAEKWRDAALAPTASEGGEPNAD